MEETTEKAKKRLEEMEPKSIQLVSLVKYIKEALSRVPLLLPPFLPSPPSPSLPLPPSLSYPIPTLPKPIKDALTRVNYLTLPISRLPSIHPTSPPFFLPPSLPPSYSLPLLCIKSTLAVLVKAIKGGSRFLPSSPPLYSCLSPSPFLSFSFSSSSPPLLLVSSPLPLLLPPSLAELITLTYRKVWEWQTT